MVDTLDPDDFNPEGKGNWYKFRAGDFKNNPDMLMDAMMNNKFKEIVIKLELFVYSQPEPLISSPSNLYFKATVSPEPAPEV